MEVTPRVVEKTHHNLLSLCTTAYQEGHDCKKSHCLQWFLVFFSSPPFHLEIFQLHPQCQHHFLFVFGVVSLTFSHMHCSIPTLQLSSLFRINFLGHAEQKSQQRSISSSITSKHLLYKCSQLLQNQTATSLHINRSNSKGSLFCYFYVKVSPLGGMGAAAFNLYTVDSSVLQLWSETKLQSYLHVKIHILSCPSVHIQWVDLLILDVLAIFPSQVPLRTLPRELIVQNSHMRIYCSSSNGHHEKFLLL